MSLSIALGTLDKKNTLDPVLKYDDDGALEGAKEVERKDELMVWQMASG